MCKVLILNVLFEFRGKYFYLRIPPTPSEGMPLAQGGAICNKMNEIFSHLSKIIRHIKINKFSITSKRLLLGAGLLSFTKVQSTKIFVANFIRIC